MRKLVIAAAALGMIGMAFLTTAPADAQEHPWCLEFGGLGLPFGRYAMLGAAVRSDSGDFADGIRQAQDDGGGRNCGFDSYDQCMAARSGIGGHCERNPFFQGTPDTRPGAPSRRTHRHAR